MIDKQVAQHDNSRLLIAQNKLSKYKLSFDKSFSKYFLELRKTLTLPKHSTFAPVCIELIKDLSLAGGKRQRVAFLYEAYKLFNLPKPKNLVPCALSVELLQTHLLIHDDLIDNSPIRRGKLTTYFQIKEILAKRGFDPKAALGLTIQTGNLAAYLALDVLQKSNLSKDKIVKITDIQINAGINTFLGQIFDLERDMVWDLKNEDLLELADFKAVRSSTLAPMLIGLVLAGKDTKSNIRRVSRYAAFVGIAGQLQDDILGLFGDSKVTGKSNLSDVIEGKRTLLIKHVIEESKPEYKSFIESVLGNAKVNISDLNMLKSIIVSSGSLDYVRDLSRQYANKAVNEVESWKGYNKESVNFFKCVAEWFIVREL